MCYSYTYMIINFKIDIKPVFVTYNSNTTILLIVPLWVTVNSVNLQPWKKNLMSLCQLCISNLPLADAGYSDSKRPLQTSAELKGITADLNDVVDESAHGSEWKGRGEEHHVAKLDKHLLVVLEGVLRAAKRTVNK